MGSKDTYRPRWLALLFLFVAGPAFAQNVTIDLPAESEPYRLIHGELLFEEEKDENIKVDRKIDWVASSKAVDFDVLGNGELVTCVATPGKHWVQANIGTTYYAEKEVLVRDPEAPDDPAKFKTIKVRDFIRFQFLQPREEFNVSGAPEPTPDPKPDPKPDPVPTPVMPSAEVQALLTPLRNLVVAGDDAKAAKAAAAWADYYITLQSAGVPQSVASFKASTTAFINAAFIKAQLQGAFPGFSTELEKAFVARFGSSDATLDQAKALEFVSGLVWACQ